MKPIIELTGHDLDLTAFDAISRGDADVAISSGARELIARGRAVVERHIADGIPVYGLNTGLGARVGEALPSESISNFSSRLIRARAQGVGEPLAPHEVRAAMLVRLNTLLSGGAGASPAVVDYLSDVLNANLIAYMPRTASIGAGDLTAMAALPFALTGEGKMLVNGKAHSALEVLKSTGREPLRLAPKDGLVLSNISSFSVGLAALAAGATRKTLQAANIAAALSMEGFRANTTVLEQPVVAARPQPGQVETAEIFRQLFAGGLLLEPGNARRLQDPLSFRCTIQVHGSADWQIAALENAVTIELNSCADSPLVLIDEARIVSSSNFHMPYLSLQLDATARALAWCANEAVSRIHRLMSPAISGLPPLLSSAETARAGFGPVLKPIEALRAEIIHLANPVPILTSFNADGAEDSVTFAALAAQQLTDLCRKMNALIGFELIAGAQAVDLAAPERIGTKLQTAYESLRMSSAALDEDRPLGHEAEAIARNLIETGKLAVDANL